MKITATLLFAIGAFGFQCNGQTLTNGGSNYQLGSQFTTVSTSYFSEGPSGSGQTWDFSTLSGTPINSSVVNPASTPSGASFPSANIAIYDQTSNAYQYYTTTSSVLSSLGISTTQTDIAYSDPEDFLRYPFALGDSYTDTFAATFVSGVTFYRTGTTTVTADATGTLITPAGTFNNVVRVHFVQDYQDSAYIGFPQVSTYINDQYIWYQNGTPAPLAATYTFTTNPGGTSQNGFYIDNIVLSNDEIQLENNNISLFPNPANEELSITWTPELGNVENIRIIDLSGKQIRQVANVNSVNGSIAMDIDDLTAGIYFVSMATENTTITKRFIKE